MPDIAGDSALGPDPTARGRADRRRQKQHRSKVTLVVVGSLIGAVGIAAAILLVTRSDDRGTVSPARPGTASSASPTSAAPPPTLPVSTTAVPRSTNPVVALAQQYDGRYVGTFTNTTFGTTGPASLEVRVDPGTGAMAIDADFDGDLFGGGAQESRRISGTISIGDPDAAVKTRTEAFGPVTGQLDPSLALVLSAPDVPDPKVRGFQLTGRLRADNSGFDATYTVTFEDGATAQGTITLGCDRQGTRGGEVPTVCPPS